MKLPILIVAVLSCIFLICVPGCDNVKEELDETLHNYLRAYTRGDGEAMLTIIDPKNIESYDRLVSIARTASGAEIARLSSIEKYWVAVIRGGSEPKELKTMDGRAVVRRWIAAPIAEERELPEITLVKIKHAAPRATGELVIAGEPTGLRMEFVQIGDKWHVNSEAFNQWFNERVLKITRAMDHSEEFVVLAVASRKVGKPLQTGIWAEPPKAR
jgi:hypothetical protein